MIAFYETLAFLPRECGGCEEARPDDQWQTIYAMSRFKLDLVEQFRFQVR